MLPRLKTKIHCVFTNICVSNRVPSFFCDLFLVRLAEWISGRQKVTSCQKPKCVIGIWKRDDVNTAGEKLNTLYAEYFYWTGARPENLYRYFLRYFLFVYYYYYISLKSHAKSPKRDRPKGHVFRLTRVFLSRMPFSSIFF